MSSAPGPAARAIVRLTGPRCRVIAKSLTSLDDADFEPRHFLAAPICLPEFHSSIATEIYYFAPPHTYTGQDIVEIHLISSPPIVDALVSECLNFGARAAQPGEFTMRAFLAGKLDLTRAEAVLGVIEAGDRQELNHALAQLAGGLAQPLRTVREDLLNLLADVEAGLDFAEEDIHFVNADQLLMRLASALAHLTLVKQQLRHRAVRPRPFRVALTGKPNAGKSSLFNALVGKAAALVSAEPGTTRDYLEATIDIDGVPIELIDTAGLGASTCAIDNAAQGLGQEQAGQADLVLWCVPADTDIEKELPARSILVSTKVDRAPAPVGALPTSALTQQGISQLRARLSAEARRRNHSAMAPCLSRCSHHVEACVQHLQHAHAIVIDESMPELLALQIRLGVEELGALVGAVYTDDLLDRIFSRFCIGK
jgi:tRNA modification GTPase